MSTEPNKELMFEQVKELCQLAGQSCFKISQDTGIPVRMVVAMFLETMRQIAKETDKEVYGESDTIWET